MFETGEDPDSLMQKENISLVSDEGELEIIARSVIEEQEQAISDYRGGKTTVITFLVGQVMAKTKGQADPEKALSVLKKLLGE